MCDVQKLLLNFFALMYRQVWSVCFDYPHHVESILNVLVRQQVLRTFIAEVLLFTFACNFLIYISTNTDSNKTSFILQSMGWYLPSQATLENWQTYDLSLTEPDIVLLGIILVYENYSCPTDLKKTGLCNSGRADVNIPGSQNSLHVVEIFAKYSMLWISPRLEKYLKFIFRNLFQIYHRVIIEMRWYKVHMPYLFWDKYVYSSRITWKQRQPINSS